MGCCSTSREIITLTDAESLIIQSVSLLPFQFKSAEFLDRTTHRCGSDLSMSRKQFEVYLHSLDFHNAPQSTIDFFRCFYNKVTRNYSVRQLSTLGILLGKGLVETKISLLFQNYDQDCSGTLCEEETKEMIEDVFYISCVCLTGLAARQYVGAKREAIEQYRKKLLEVKNSICKHYLRIFLEDEKDTVSLNVFKMVMKRKEMEGMLDPVKFRMNTEKIFEIALRVAAAVKEYMNPDEKFKDAVKQFILTDRDSNKKLLS